VHVDVLFQAYFNACLILGTPPAGGGIGCPVNPDATPTSLADAGRLRHLGRALLQDHPVRGGHPRPQGGLVPEVVRHRRLRPEAFGGRVHLHKKGLYPYPLHQDVLRAGVLPLLHRRNGSYLLPQAFPEGSPTHPSYGAGHATVAGACVTLLKALFDETFVIPQPVVPDPTGTTLLPHTGPALTVGGELDKLASNVATAATSPACTGARTRASRCGSARPSPSSCCGTRWPCATRT